MRTASLTAVLVLFAATTLYPDAADAKGGSRRSSSGSTSSSSSTAKSEPASKTININVSGGSGSGSGSTASTAAAVAGGAAIGSYAGRAMANAARPDAEPPKMTPEEEKRWREAYAAREQAEAEARERRATEQAEAEAKRSALIAQADLEEQKRRQAEATAAKRRAIEERQRAWEERCQIKPVMTDAEIATCREVRSRPAP